MGLNPNGVGVGEGFQFLGIPPKGELDDWEAVRILAAEFPISRDPPEGGTQERLPFKSMQRAYGFQFLGIPPKGERIIGFFSFLD